MSPPRSYNMQRNPKLAGVGTPPPGALHLDPTFNHPAGTVPAGRPAKTVSK
jgi:hypothetical protein